MGRVSYFWSGGDQAGNPLFYEVTGLDDEILQLEGEHGFNYDDATFRTKGFLGHLHGPRVAFMRTTHRSTPA